MEHEKSYTVYNEPFRLLVTGLIESEDIDVRELVKGLCDIEEWEKLLNGEKLMSKLFMDRILHRLGGYVKSIDMLLYDDGYEDWKMRIEIVFAIEDNKLDYAKEVLEKYTVRKKCEGRTGRGNLNKNFPVYLPELEKMLSDAAKKQYETDLEGNILTDKNGSPVEKSTASFTESGKNPITVDLYAVTDEEIEDLWYIFDNIGVWQSISSPTDEIFWDEIENFVSGIRSAEQTARALQDRMTLMLEEAQ